MVRKKSITIMLNEEEYNELKERSIKSHLSLAAFCRSYLLTEQNNVAYIKQGDIDIRRLRKPKPPTDPYASEKKESHAVFRTSVVGELKEAFLNGNKLKSIPKEVKEEMKERLEERKHEVNREIQEIKMKNIEAGFLDDDDW